MVRNGFPKVLFKTCTLIHPVEAEKAIKYVISSSRATLLDGMAAWTIINPFIWEMRLLNLRKVWDSC